MARQAAPSTQQSDATRRVFETRAGRALSGEDVREISANLAGFFGVLGEWERETSSRLGACQVMSSQEEASAPLPHQQGGGNPA